MNSCCFLVKIVSRPEENIISENIITVNAQVKFAKMRKKRSFDRFQIHIWGKLGKHYIKNYRLGDYVIIEGILSFKKFYTAARIKKQTYFTVLKLYPFLLTEDGFKTT